MRNGDAFLLKKDRPEVTIGTFDVSADINSKLDSKDLLFAVDQRPYLQRTLPVPILTIYANSKSILENRSPENGPSFVYASPPEEDVTCETNYYPICDKIDIPEDDEINDAKSSSSFCRRTVADGSNFGHLLQLTMLVATTYASVVFWER